MKHRFLKSCLALMWVVLAAEAGVHAQQLQGQLQGQRQQQQIPERKVVRVGGRVRGRLNELGFAVVPNRHGTSLSRMYRLWQHQHLPVVVTSDAALHTCHLHFDWYQRFLEIAYLRDDLVNLTDALSTKMMAYHDETRDGNVKEAALANAATFIIGKRLLTGADAADAPEPWKQRIESELKLIREARGFARSPLFGTIEDYSQYKPRGHYSRSEALKRYFQGMMWHGRMTYRCQTQDPRDAIEQTRRAMLICLALKSTRVKGEETLAVFIASRSDIACIAVDAGPSE